MLLPEQQPILSNQPGITDFEPIPYQRANGDWVIAYFFTNGTIQVTQECGEELLSKLQEQGKKPPKYSYPVDQSRKRIQYHGPGPW